MNQIIRFSFGLLCAVTLLSACGRSDVMDFRDHPLRGAWLATDETIFNFRDDGTFHGVDFRQREIWGNWVILSEERIGFRSLLHDSSYAPQYAIIRQSNRDEMDYIVSGGTWFIDAKRIPTDEAMEQITKIVTPQIHRPKVKSGG